MFLKTVNRGTLRRLVSTSATKGSTEAVSVSKRDDYYKNLGAQTYEDKPAGWDEALPFEAIPGPKPLPILGNNWRFLPYVGEYHDVPRQEFYKRLKDDYGNITVLKGLMGRKPSVLLFDSSDMETLFRNTGPYPIRQGLESVVYYRNRVRDDVFQGVGGVLTVQGEEWFKLRTMANPILMQPRVAQKYIGVMDTIASELIENINYFAEQNVNSEMPEDFIKELYKWSLESIGVVALNRRLAYRSSVHETTGQTPASIVMGRELRLPCDLKFGCTPGDDVAGEDYVSTLRQRMDDIHERVRSNIQGASDRMKETYDINANDGRYQPGNQVWLYNPQRRRGLSPKLQSSWEGPYEVVTRINDVVYRIQKLPRGKPRVVHFNRLAPFAGSNDEQAEARVRHVSPPDGELSFEEFMSLHSNGQKARYGVTREEPRDLFQTPADFCLAHCVAADLRMSRGIALTFKKAFGQLEELRRQRPEVGRVLQITAAEQEKERSVFYLVTKQLSHHKPTYQTVWDTLVELRDVLLSQSISSLAIPKIASGLDGLDWRVIRSMLEVLFRFTGIEILVCCYNPRRSLNEKTVDCFFYQTSRCKNGSFCRYRCLDRNLEKGSDIYKFIESVTKAIDMLYYIEILPSVWKIVRTPSWKKAVHYMNITIDTAVKYINETLAQPVDENVPDNELSVLHRLLKIDKKFAIAMVIDMLAAGIDTTGRTLGAALYFLAKNPEAQERLRAEALQNLPTKDSPITKEILNNSPLR
ncbi:hypothetical protein NQ318_001079 [Aromia moschata]|uniref:C3H1-type domain-containing protein n=1 Tax=Aromia moschata TaxID=1265417 RepID=A0AAV8ZH47_9CUCU|nr:hypothetical protein NQ318_001079 [Aromia moschata]